MTEHHEDIIIGGGVVGLCTAYHLAKLGAKPLILEQVCLRFLLKTTCPMVCLIISFHFWQQFQMLTILNIICGVFNRLWSETK